MKLRIIIVLFIALATLSAQAQWQKQTPRESHPVPSDGSTVNFPTVSLPVGMEYHIHTDGRVNVSSGSDIADACYYVNVTVFPPTGGLISIPVAMKVRYGPSSEDWVYSFLNPKNYQSSHIYDLNLASTGSALSFRFFDRADPPSAYYNDNSGSINVEVAQETPELAVKYDTVYFSNVLVGTQKAVLDSIETYGLQAYQCGTVALVGPSASKFGVISENTIPMSLISETTNWFQFTYTPPTLGNDTAYFHLHSSNVYAPQSDFVIVLIANSVGSKLSVRPDTLNFGTIKAGTTKQLTEAFLNSGTTAATINSITMTPASQPFAAMPTTVTVQQSDSAFTTVTFSPPAVGNYFARFDCTASDGSSLVFYAKGIAGSERLDVSDSVLDFGRVILNQSRTLPDTIFSTGTVNANVISTFNSNPAEYTTIGGQGPRVIAPGSVTIYGFTFKPVVHIPGWGNHAGSFTFNLDDGTSKTIVFKGCDYAPLPAHLAIERLYTVTPGNNVDVYQYLVDPLDSTYTPTRSLTERISYDAGLLDLVSVTKGLLVSAADWLLQTTPGNGYVDIKLTATSSHLGPTGPLLTLTFKAHPSDTAGEFSLLPQTNIDFSRPLEFDTIGGLTGLITITDLCSPVNMTNKSAFGTFIEQNLPNPVTSHSVIRYHVGIEPSVGIPVRVTLYDAMGRLIRTLVDEQKTSGDYDLSISASDLAGGMYWYVLEAGGVTDSRSMIIAK